MDNNTPGAILFGIFAGALGGVLLLGIFLYLKATPPPAVPGAAAYARLPAASAVQRPIKLKSNADIEDYARLLGHQAETLKAIGEGIDHLKGVLNERELREGLNCYSNKVTRGHQPVEWGDELVASEWDDRWAKR